MFSGLGPLHLIVVLVIVLVLFGRGRISDVMGEFGKGLKSFKQGMTDETADHSVTPPPAQIAAPPSAAPEATLNGETTVDSSQSQPQ